MNEWTSEITPHHKWYDLKLKEVWEYRDLIAIFVRRNIVALYKQTILGPLWFFLGPVFTVITYTFVFNKVANISTDGIPAPIFYLAGTTIWNYFQASFGSTSNTFRTNAGIFGKVYFPRLVAPISDLISNLLKFFIQMLMFSLFWIYYAYKGEVTLSLYVLTLPLLVLLMAAIALGVGIIISSLTTKYRDLSYFVGFGVGLLMYITPVIYPISALPSWGRRIVLINPLSPIVETFRLALTGKGTFDFWGLVYSTIFAAVVLIVGLILFNRVERTFMDTV